MLKFAHDRRRWLYWCSNAGREIAQRMQLIAGRTAREYNQRKRRRGAFWEDLYHASAVDAEHHLARCMLYIDLNMVRAGVLSHPGQWPQCGYREIQSPPRRYRSIDIRALMELLAIGDLAELQRVHAQWVANALRAEDRTRERIWSESLAVGGEAFVKRIKASLGRSAYHRDLVANGGGVHSLRESTGIYTVNYRPINDLLMPENEVLKA